MTIEELLRWAETHHYPQLVLAEQDVLRHGEEHYQHLVAGTQERIECALKRIEQWQQREGVSE